MGGRCSSTAETRRRLPIPARAPTRSISPSTGSPTRAPGQFGPTPRRDRLVGPVPDVRVGGHLGGHPDLCDRGGLPILESAVSDLSLHGVLPLSCRFLGGTADPNQSGSAKAIMALPWPAPSMPGRNPSAHAPHPTGTAMYCLPSTE